ncbi:hypothetical protein PVAND_004176 [Polypedilum vanderplanki]|uniref:Uncharacterized protein n=1 Tax=Polypedilum vanderplanki TaxID=319348 RepID=A0A9J6BWS9_POLVA|nr:hypothetical protein PVAND_004176 [Polypedilum vanderplanki]
MNENTPMDYENEKQASMRNTKTKRTPPKRNTSKNDLNSLRRLPRTKPKLIQVNDETSEISQNKTPLSTKRKKKETISTRSPTKFDKASLYEERRAEYFLDSKNSKHNKFAKARNINISEYEDQEETEFSEINEFEEKSNKIRTAQNEFNKLLNNDTIETKEVLKSIGRVLEAMNERDEKIVNEISKCTDYVRTEMEFMRKEVEMLKKSDEIEEIKTIDSCRSDLKKVYLRFKFRSEAQKIREEGNFPTHIVKILASMGIKFPGLLPVENAFFENRKFGREVVPELTLCCIFVSSTYARIMKSGVLKFNNDLVSAGKETHIRYSTSVNWSINVWKIYRILLELQRFKLIKNAIITNEGIKAKFEDESFNRELDIVTENKEKTVKVNTFTQLDSLRQTIKDVRSYVPAKNIYNDDYFKINFDSRNQLRSDAAVEENQIESNLISFENVPEVTTNNNDHQ